MNRLLDALRARQRRAVARAASRSWRARAGVTLLLGLALGLLLAWRLASLVPGARGEIEEARSLGIVSATVLLGYSKTREVRIYVLSVGLAVVGAIVALWLDAAFVPGEPDERAETEGARESAPELTFLELALVTLGVVYAAFDPARFGSYWVNRWAFLSEEGLLLSAAERVLEGGVIYRDEFALYGPLTLYGPAWLMELLGPHVLVLRAWFFVLDVVGFLVVYVVLRKLVVRRWLALLGLAFFLVNYSRPCGFDCFDFRPSAHHSVLRSTASLAWIPLLLKKDPAWWRPATAGIAVGLAGLVSQEIGVGSALVLLATALARPVFEEASWRTAVRDALAALSGLATVLGIVALVFARLGALTPLVATLVAYPRTVTLGYGNLPFPSLDTLAELVEMPIRTMNATRLYWVPFATCTFAAILGARLVLRRARPDDRASFALVLLALGLFRSALGRSDLSHVQGALVPAVVLSFVGLDRLVQAVREGALELRSPSSVAAAIFLALSIVMLLRPAHVPLAFLELQIPWNKVAAEDPSTRTLAIERAHGVRVDRELADELEGIVRFLERHTRPGEPIVAFPNGTAIHFYAARPSASRFAQTYLAVTREDRLEAIASWEHVRPRFVVGSIDGMRIDGIPPDVQVPELAEYLRTRYVPVAQFGKSVILERRVP